MSRKPSEGWHGWDDYAAFYDWENARTVGRRDIPFWRRFVGGERHPVLELGAGTGRLLLPLARAGARVTGIDRSRPMLARARARLRRLPPSARARLVQGDIRALPFPPASFGAVIAGYGILQSLLDDADLGAALGDVARVLRPGGRFGIDLVPDLVKWDEYDRRVSLRGRTAGARRLTLVETVRQDHRRRLTIFDEEFIVTQGRKVQRHRFSLTFRTVAIEEMRARLETAGLQVESCFGDYRGGSLNAGADAWLILARRA
jgi:SAM-dependent methyltransferase